MVVIIDDIDVVVDNLLAQIQYLVFILFKSGVSSMLKKEHVPILIMQMTEFHRTSIVGVNVDNLQFIAIDDERVLLNSSEG
jgi:hypothetical protein